MLVCKRQHVPAVIPSQRWVLPSVNVRPPPRCAVNSQQHDKLLQPVQPAGDQQAPPDNFNGQRGSNQLVVGLVSAMTESLRIFGVGKQRYQEVAMLTSPNAPLPPGGLSQELLDRLTADFQRAYFVTGLIDDSIYAPNCEFIDPTVQFSGVELWKRNLQLLVPFLLDPCIEQLSMRAELGSCTAVEVDWNLSTSISLPWKPFVCIHGRTVYTLNPDGNRIVRHEEFWDVSPWEALLMLFRPGRASR